MQLNLSPAEITALFKLLNKISYIYSWDADLSMFTDKNADFLLDFYKEEFQALMLLLSDIS